MDDTNTNNSNVNPNPIPVIPSVQNVENNNIAATATGIGNEKAENEKRSLRQAIRSAVGIVIVYSIAFFCWNMTVIPKYFGKAKSTENSNSTTASPIFSRSTYGYIEIAERIFGLLLTFGVAALFFVGTSKSKNDQDPRKCICFTKIALIIMICQCVFAFVVFAFGHDPDEKKSVGDTWRVVGYALFHALFTTLLALLRERFKKLLQPQTPVQLVDDAAATVVVDAVGTDVELLQQGQTPVEPLNAEEAPVAK